MKSPYSPLIAILLAALVLAFVADARPTTLPAQASTTRISVSSADAQSNNDSCYPAISDDGRYVIFTSLGDNLVPNDTNGAEDIFLRDRLTNTTTRISHAWDGGESNGASSDPAISRDARYVAFHSLASNLVLSDTNGLQDVFVYDRETDTTERVSVSTTGVQGDTLSEYPLLSYDGKVVTFRSAATTLVPNDTNGKVDEFVHDLVTHTTTRVSVSTAGDEANDHSDYAAISGDGRYITYASLASNLVPSDTNALSDVFLFDRTTSTTTRVNVSVDGAQALNGWSGFPNLSADGRYLAFVSRADNLVLSDTNALEDIFFWDRQLHTLTRINQPSTGGEALGGSSGDPWMTADGRLIAFTSLANNLIPDDTNGWEDTFIHDRLTGLTLRANLDSAGHQALNGWSGEPWLVPSGRYLAFGSVADNLVADDTNSKLDAFVRLLGVYQAYLPLSTR